MHLLKKKILVSMVLLAVLAVQLAVPSSVMAADARYAALVIDADTGAVLHQENAGKSRYPASLTKMMTLYLAFQALERGTITMNKRVRVSAHAAAQKPSDIGLRPGQTVAIRDLFDAIIIKSANDAAVVMAEGLAGSESQFAVLMTRTASSLGMKHTNFTNASGLPDNRQVTTAYDMARLAIALRRDFPRYYPMFARSSFTYNGRTYYSHNRVTKNYRGADGLKTGYIRASGFNLVTSARRGDKSVVGVVMGGRSIKSRDTNMVKLLDQAFYKMVSGNVRGAPVLKMAAAYSGKIMNTPTPKLKKSVLIANAPPSNATNQQEVFSRNVAVINDSNIPAPQYKRDIFSPGINLLAMNKNVVVSENEEPAEFDDLRPTRVKVRGKVIPVPEFRPFPTEKGLVILSPHGSRQSGINVAEAR